MRAGTMPLDPIPGEVQGFTRNGLGPPWRRGRGRRARIGRPDRIARALPRQELTLATFLSDWLTDTVTGSVRPKTATSYRSLVRLHLVPALGEVPLAALSPAEVQAS